MTTSFQVLSRSFTEKFSMQDSIRKTLHESGVIFSFYEIAWAQHAFIRDESSKGRYDEILLELFNRTLKLDLGQYTAEKTTIENVC